jgi:phosphotriesterase-related protein
MQIQTVTGAIPLERIGRTLMHEHLLIRYPGAELDPTMPFDRAAFVVTKFVPLLRERGLSDTEIWSLLDDNPRRFFSGTAN